MTMRTIYIDMDDVVADWMSHAETILNRTLERGGLRVPDNEWEKLKREPRFYRHLPLREGGRELVKWVTQYIEQTPNTQAGFLTAIPRDNDMIWAPYDKVMWGQDHFPHIPVFFGPYSTDKHKHARPGDILIDDRESNIIDWSEAGGIAHLYREWDECQIWLETTLGVKL